MLKKLGAQLESVQKESFFQEGRFQDNAVYVLFEETWPVVKDRLQRKLSEGLNLGTRYLIRQSNRK